MIPYDYRPGIGRIYRTRKRSILESEHFTVEQKKEFVFNRVKAIAVYAFNNIPFYKELYQNNGINPESLKTFDELDSLPIITKADLQSVPLEFRSFGIKGRLLENTGGSSGHPLELYIEPNSVGHEWAHMHYIWKKLGFKQSDLKVVFGGRADVENVVQYDSARHQFNVDIYSGWQSVADKLLQIFDKYSPKYLHGYPSSIFDFMIWLDNNNHPLLPIMRNHIKGMFLGSELPSPHLRSTTEKILDCKSISWYGHTERSILAYEESAPGIYSPFVTYGFAEMIDDGRLICTSYYNRASPLIRYDTGDRIEGNLNHGLLESFTISDGREGEYVLDKLGNKIFLTGLVFGRHHRLFDIARHIQIYQPRIGAVVVLVTPRDELTPEDASEYFDTSNVQLDFEFRVIAEPIRTKVGKVPLLVKNV
ncbi:phenylacetate-CoA ligase [Pseudidiomarina indica]|uniref:Phenylacetate-CoA ligase n=1 Tax=Pseudidiomarina indica TaxID=1159017 RepID=A0A1G6AUN2_9GAMM|nr:phenylacetate-CoA ligase [Pseudidiomarina indica]